MGLARLNSLISHLKNSESIVNEAVRTSLQENEKVVLDLNRSQLYNDGENSDGIAIKSYQPYKPSTILRKIRKRQPTNRVTLRDEGDFYAGFYAYFKPDSFYIHSKNFVFEFLEKRYGENIFGLTKESIYVFSKTYSVQQTIKDLKKW